MNTIKTVGDIKKALSVYDDNLKFRIFNGDEELKLGTDLQIYMRVSPITEELYIDLVEQDK